MEIIGNFFGKLIGGIFKGIIWIFVKIFGFIFVPITKGLFSGLPWWGKLIIVLIIISILINILGPIIRFIRGTCSNAKDIVTKTKNKDNQQINKNNSKTKKHN